MSRALAALAATLFCGAASGQAPPLPSYSTASIANASNYSLGPFAPNSVLSLFGVNLAFSTQGLTSDNTSTSRLPFQLGSAVVYVDNTPVPLLFASPGQINFLIPTNQLNGDLKVRVVRQGITGPEVIIAQVDAAPALFQTSAGYAIAEDWNANYAVITPDLPAHPLDMIVLYTTGLGRTQPNPLTGEIPQYPGSIENMSTLKVLLDGSAIDPLLIKYAGITPGFAGLYQINLILPGNTGTNPEIRVAMGNQTSPPGLLLAVSPQPQLSGALAR